MNRPYMFGYSTVIRDNPCDCPFSETTRSEHHRQYDLTLGRYVAPERIISRSRYSARTGYLLPSGSASGHVWHDRRDDLSTLFSIDVKVIVYG